MPKTLTTDNVRSTEVIDKSYLIPSDYELEVATGRIKAQVTLDPLYDSKMESAKS